MHDEYDKLQNDLEIERKQRKSAEGDLSKVVDEIAALKVTLAEVKDERKTLAELIEECKKEIDELEEEKKRALEERDAERIQKESALHERTQMEAKLETKQKEMKLAEEKQAKEVKSIQEKLNETTAKLERFTKEAKQHSMMDLEIADYERTVQNLNAAITEHEKIEGEKNTEIKRLEEKVASLSKQLGRVLLQMELMHE